MGSRSCPGAAAAAAVAASTVGQPAMDLGVVLLAAAVAGLAAGLGAAAVGVAVLWTWGREKGAPGAVSTGDSSNAAVWEAMNGKAPTTTAAELAAAVAARALSPAPAPEGGGRRVSMSSWQEADLTPPLPADVMRLLQASRLCFLSTFCDDHPHLSLMNFTYHPDDEVIILSTRRDTKKYKLVQTARHVAILVHEFPDTGNSSADYNSVGGGIVNSDNNNSSSNIGSSGGSGTQGQGAAVPPSPQKRSGKVTITLNGSASIQEGALAEKYRALHAQKNPDSKTFIVGPNIAIITVRVRTARICNVRDEVTLWDVANPSNAN